MGILIVCLFLKKLCHMLHVKVWNLYYYINVSIEREVDKLYYDFVEF